MKTIIETEELIADLRGLTPREMGVYMAIYLAYAHGDPLIWGWLLTGDTEGWIVHSLRQLRRKGKIVRAGDNVVPSRRLIAREVRR